MNRVALQRTPSAGRLHSCQRPARSSSPSRHTRIRSYRGLCASYLTLNETPVAELASYPAAAALYLRDWLCATDPDGGSGYEVGVSPGFDGRFDALWNALKTESPEVLLAERSSAALEWHFRFPLAAGAAWIVTASRARSL